MSDNESIPDLFESTYDRTLDNVFLRVVPKREYRASFSPYQTIYFLDKTRFKVITGAHQNHAGDLFHIGVEMDGAYGWKTRLHINGYWKNYFNAVSVTRQESDGTVTTLAEF